MITESFLKFLDSNADMTVFFDFSSNCLKRKLFFKLSATDSSSVVDKLFCGGFQLSDFNFAGFNASADTEVLLLVLKDLGISPCGEGSIVAIVGSKV